MAHLLGLAKGLGSLRCPGYDSCRNADVCRVTGTNLRRAVNSRPGRQRWEDRFETASGRGQQSGQPRFQTYHSPVTPTGEIIHVPASHKTDLTAHAVKIMLQHTVGKLPLKFSRCIRKGITGCSNLVYFFHCNVIFLCKCFNVSFSILLNQ